MAKGEGNRTGGIDTVCAVGTNGDGVAMNGSGVVTSASGNSSPFTSFARPVRPVGSSIKVSGVMIPC